MDGKEALEELKKELAPFQWIDFKTQKETGCCIYQKHLDIIEKDLEKLEKLKDIEEKHNIDLLNALSILDNGIWIFYEEGKIINVKPTLKLIDNSYWFEYDYFIYKPNDYGRTWALTKEELL